MQGEAILFVQQSFYPAAKKTGPKTELVDEDELDGEGPEGDDTEAGNDSENPEDGKGKSGEITSEATGLLRGKTHSAKGVDETFAWFVLGDGCRQVPLDKYFDNPPREGLLVYDLLQRGKQYLYIYLFRLDRELRAL